MQDKINNALATAIDALEIEIKKIGTLSPERVLALTEAIKALSGINPAKVTYQPSPDHQPETENITRQANYKIDEQIEPGSVYVASMPSQRLSSKEGLQKC